ncbi:MAG: nucleotide exchange factor GrpE [Pseudomonadota bacterium]
MSEAKMSQSKARVEPEVAMPGDSMDAEVENTGPEGKKVDLSDLTVEDLVPGLEDEIARADAQDTVADQIAALEAERDDFKDKWTRALAEAENVRRRALREKKDAETYGGTKLARDLLAVYDNLDRAMNAVDDELREKADAFIQGIELTQRELLNAFEKHKIQKVTPEIGEKFDPNRHQAMFQAPIPGAEPDTVIEKMQDGFVIADRLLRPAFVGIATAATAAPEEPVPEGRDPDDFDD